MTTSNYKPLLFTTTVRNPARFKQYLFILQKFECEVLTDDLAVRICGEAMKYGIYRPNKKTSTIKSKWATFNGDFGESLLDDDEIAWLLKHNPQQHKEAGFKQGWASRFATIFGALNQFGFAYIAPNEPIRISPIGKCYVGNIKVTIDDKAISVEDGNPQLDQAIFTHAMVKYHRDNPFLRVLNTNTPLILLLSVIKLLNADPHNKDVGISRQEIPLLIFWKDNDAQKAYEMIMELRQKYKYNPSPEVIADYCLNKIMGGIFKKFKLKSITNEYPDEYIRKMRYTGLLSLRGGGRFLDINHDEEEKVDYILTQYSDYKTYSDKKTYYEYVSTIDPKILNISTSRTDTSRGEQLLNNWTAVFPWEIIRKELLILSSHKPSTDRILRVLDYPIRLEFLTAIAIKVRRPNYRVKPNYKCDDEGLPTSTASGDKGDIECYGIDNVLVEVTMSKGRVQTIMEGWPIKRHLEDFATKVSNASCVFVAPEVYKDTKDQLAWTYDKTNLYTASFSIKEFVEELELDKVSLTTLPDYK